jgi:hypothetical protein
MSNSIIHDPKKHPVCAPFYGEQGVAYTRVFKPSLMIGGLWPETDESGFTLAEHLLQQNEGSPGNPFHGNAQQVAKATRLALRGAEEASGRPGGAGSSITTEVTARAHIARERSGLVLRRCPEIPPEHMQGGSRCPGPAVEPERAQWHDPVLGRWLGLTPERPALCLRGFPGRPKVALSRVSDPPGLGRR